MSLSVGGLLLLSSLASTQPLRICTVIEAGFDMLIAGADAASVTSDASLAGYNVEVRRAVLSGHPYTVRIIDSWSRMQSLARTNECDIGWAANYVYGSRDRCTAACLPESGIAAALDMSPYRCCLDFSVQYLPWSVSILSPAGHQKSFFEALVNVVTKNFFGNFVSFVFLLMVFFGHLVWLAERGVNPHFPRKYLDGVDDGVWWAVATATTVGYGDLVPVTPAGRLLAIIYMMIGLSCFSILSGFIASEFIAGRQESGGITAVEELAGARVCGYPSVLSSALFQGVAFATVAGETMEECGMLLKTGSVDAIVWDTPTMLYWRAQDVWAMTKGLRVTEPLDSLLVGIVVREGGFANDNRLATVHADLIDFIMSDAFESLKTTWFPTTTADHSSFEEPPDWPMIGVAIALASLYVLVQLGRFTRTCLEKRSSVKVDPHNKSGSQTCISDPEPPSAGVVDGLGDVGKLSHLEAKLVACLRQEITT